MKSSDYNSTVPTTFLIGLKVLHILPKYTTIMFPAFLTFSLKDTERTIANMSNNSDDDCKINYKDIYNFI